MAIKKMGTADQPHRQWASLNLILNILSGNRIDLFHLQMSHQTIFQGCTRSFLIQLYADKWNSGTADSLHPQWTSLNLILNIQFGNRIVTWGRIKFLHLFHLQISHQSLFQVWARSCLIQLYADKWKVGTADPLHRQWASLNLILNIQCGNRIVTWGRTKFLHHFHSQIFHQTLFQVWARSC